MAKLITDPEKIRLQEQDEVQALLGRTPAWFTQWGVSAVAGAVVLLLLVGHRLRYPEVVEAPAAIQTEAPVIRLKAKLDGRIDQLMVANNEAVDSGQILALLQNPVRLPVVQQIGASVRDLIQAIDNRAINKFQLPQGLPLANLQPAYSELSALLDAQQYRLLQDDAGRKIALFKEQIDYLGKLDLVSQTEIDTLREEARVTRFHLEQLRNVKNKVNGAVSPLELEQAQLDVLRANRALEAKERDLIDTRLQEQELRSNMITLAQGQSNDIKEGWVQLLEAARKMTGALEEWEDLYLIRAPLRGQVLLSRFWSENQAVQAGETVLTIDPGHGQSRIIARAELPVARAGKVKTGQEVLLRLQSYPYKEFGVLEGRVEYISPIPENAGTESLSYPILVALSSDELVTTADSVIIFQQELQATARIITADRSFLSRILDELYSIFRKS